MCQHFNQIGDNYGLTCQDCGEVLEGYGYWGEGSNVCLHHWIECVEDNKYEQCLYCEYTRLKVEVN
jgi:hypothetical protein